MSSSQAGKQVVLWAAIVVWLVAGAAGIAANGQSETEAPPSPVATTARIEYLEGDVRLDGAPAEIGDTVRAGARLTTGTDGLAEIVFGSGNALRVEADTELTLDLDDPGTGMDVRRGTVAAVFEGLETIGVGTDRTFRVGTPTTVAGVRGTVFFIRVESEDSTYVCTCHGELSFDDGNMTVRAARHNASRFVRTDAGISAEAAREIYHDSASLNAVADVAGVTIQWGEEPEL